MSQTKVGALDFSDLVWLTENPEVCTVFIRRQMKVCKKLFGKQSPERLCWKDARKTSRTLARRRNDEEDRIDDQTGDDTSDPNDDLMVAHAANHLLVKLISAEKSTYLAENRLGFMQRTYIRHKRLSEVRKRRYVDDMSPWEAACARAIGLGVF